MILDNAWFRFHELYTVFPLLMHFPSKAMNAKCRLKIQDIWKLFLFNSASTTFSSLFLELNQYFYQSTGKPLLSVIRFVPDLSSTNDNIIFRKQSLHSVLYVEILSTLPDLPFFHHLHCLFEPLPCTPFLLAYIFWDPFRSLIPATFFQFCFFTSS